METPARKTNKAMRYAILVAALIFLAWTFFQERKPLIKEGQLEYRMLAGSVSGQFRVIMLETPDRYIILDSAFRQVLKPAEAEMITRPIQLQLLEKYNDLEYRAGFSEPSWGLKPTYRVTRETFNAVSFARINQYKVNKKQRDQIVMLFFNKGLN
jgi:hypothetical protein